MFSDFKIMKALASRNVFELILYKCILSALVGGTMSTYCITIQGLKITSLCLKVYTVQWTAGGSRLLKHLTQQSGQSQDVW